MRGDKQAAPAAVRQTFCDTLTERDGLLDLEAHLFGTWITGGAFKRGDKVRVTVESESAPACNGNCWDGFKWRYCVKQGKHWVHSDGQVKWDEYGVVKS